MFGSHFRRYYVMGLIISYVASHIIRNKPSLSRAKAISLEYCADPCYVVLKVHWLGFR